MASLGTTINTDELEPSRGVGTFPAGEYSMHIIENSVEAASTGKGQLLKLTWEVVEGEYEKHRLWENVNYQHDSKGCQEIAQRHIKSICDAVGFTGLLEDADVLMFIPMLCRVGTEKGKPNPKGGMYADKNKIMSVKPLTAVAPAGKPATAPAAKPAAAVAAKPAATTAAAKPAAAPGGSRPWQRKSAEVPF